MKNVLHVIERDLDEILWGEGWVSWDVSDEHWLYLWEDIVG